jgi:hypothetical protein
LYVFVFGLYFNRFTLQPLQAHSPERPEGP